MVGETRLTNTVQIKKAMIVTILSLLLLSVAGVGTATADPGSSYTGLTIVDASSDSVTIQGDTSCLRPDQPYRGDLPRGACNDESSGTPEIEAHLELVVIGEDGDEKRYANEPGFDVEEVDSLYEEIDIEEYIEGYSADEEITIRIELWDYDPLSKGEDGNPEKITEDSAVINSQPGPLSDKDDDGIVYSNDECPNEPEDIDLDEDSDGCPESESTADSNEDGETSTQTEGDGESQENNQDSDGDGDGETPTPDTPTVNTSSSFDLTENWNLTRDLVEGYDQYVVGIGLAEHREHIVVAEHESKGPMEGRLSTIRKNDGTILEQKEISFPGRGVQSVVGNASGRVWIQTKDAPTSGWQIAAYDSRLQKVWHNTDVADEDHEDVRLNILEDSIAGKDVLISGGQVHGGWIPVWANNGSEIGNIRTYDERRTSDIDAVSKDEIWIAAMNSNRVDTIYKHDFEGNELCSNRYDRANNLHGLKGTMVVHGDSVYVAEPLASGNSLRLLRFSRSDCSKMDVRDISYGGAAVNPLSAESHSEGFLISLDTDTTTQVLSFWPNMTQKWQWTLNPPADGQAQVREIEYHPQQDTYYWGGLWESSQGTGRDAFLFRYSGEGAGGNRPIPTENTDAASKGETGGQNGGNPLPGFTAVVALIAVILAVAATAYRAS